MTTINPYLNFDGKTEAAFNFYKSVFGGEFEVFQRMKEAPSTENFTEEEKKRVMHVSLPLGNGFVLMASDIIPSAGHKITEGTNFSISVSPESREDATRIFNALAAGGTIGMPLADMFWGAYYGMCTDKFGIQWMVNYSTPKK
jgi:PhnB protein